MSNIIKNCSTCGRTNCVTPWESCRGMDWNANPENPPPEPEDYDDGELFAEDR